MHASAESETFRLTDQARFRAVGEEGVLVHLESGRVIVVNEVGLYVVQQLKEARTREALVLSIASEFDVSTEQAARDLDTFLSDLDQEQILEWPR